MKTLFSLCFTFFIMGMVYAQSPDAFHYQAVVRDGDGTIMTNQEIGVQIRLLLNASDGSPVYTEEHTVTTNAFGLINLNIGEGSSADDFTSLDWSAGTYFIEISTDLSGGKSYQLIGVSQILSVPYALHAKTAEEYTETDPVYAASEAARLEAGDAAKLANLSGTNTGDQDLDGYATTSMLSDSTVWKQSGSDILYNSGNIGIGTPQPGAKLDITTSTDSAVLIKFNTDRPWQFEQKDTEASTRLQLRSISGSKRFNIVNNTSGIVASFYAVGEDEVGGVGIGREGSSLYSLDVEGEIASRTKNAFRLRNDNSSILLRNDGVYFYILHTDNNDADGDWNSLRPFRISLQEGDVSIGNHALFVEHDGNVGIGTSSPDTKLHVNGATKIEDLVGSGTRRVVAEADGTLSTEKHRYEVGDFAQGGIVFWVDETGQHGLVCAKADQQSVIRWYAGTYGNTQSKGDGPYAGEANTTIIIAAHVAIGDDGNTYAARLCNELQVTEGGKTYGDWYLPSKEELDLMYQNKTIINATAGANGGSGFADSYYWSSTENSITSAWRQDFGSGSQTTIGKSGSGSVRAVRAF